MGDINFGNSFDWKNNNVLDLIDSAETYLAENSARGELYQI